MDFQKIMVLKKFSKKLTGMNQILANFSSFDLKHSLTWIKEERIPTINFTFLGIWSVKLTFCKVLGDLEFGVCIVEVCIIEGTALLLYRTQIIYNLFRISNLMVPQTVLLPCQSSWIPVFQAIANFGKFSYIYNEISKFKNIMKICE